MSLIRPEVAAALRRWRETALAGGVALWGLWWALSSFGLIRAVGVVLLLVGAALAWAAVQRARFGAGSGGLGLVEVDERQVLYLAPVGGGMASIEALTEVSLAPDRAGLPVWRLRSGIELLTIPATAQGTAALFDVLTALPGADIEAAIRASRGRPDAPVVVWRRRQLSWPPGSRRAEP